MRPNSLSLRLPVVFIALRLLLEVLVMSSNALPQAAVPIALQLLLVTTLNALTLSIALLLLMAGMPTLKLAWAPM